MRSLRPRVAEPLAAEDSGLPLAPQVPEALAAEKLPARRRYSNSALNARWSIGPPQLARAAWAERWSNPPEEFPRQK